jgi:KaiC/GvpD/RAD55 family RecA-like ATPase
MEEIDEEPPRVVKTGMKQFDNLLELPFYSNVLLLGPSNTGKEIILKNLIKYNIGQGVPTFYIVIDKSVSDLRENLKLFQPKLDAFEKKGIIYYIELHSKGKSLEKEEPNTIYFDNLTDTDEILSGIDEHFNSIEKNLWCADKIKNYNLGLDSISGFIKNSNFKHAFNFLEKLTAKCKNSKITGLYLTDTLDLSIKDYSSIIQLMDGMIRFEIMDTKYYFRIESSFEIINRDWIEYEFSEIDFVIKMVDVDIFPAYDIE